MQQRRGPDRGPGRQLPQRQWHGHLQQQRRLCLRHLRMQEAGKSSRGLQREVLWVWQLQLWPFQQQALWRWESLKKKNICIICITLNTDSSSVLRSVVISVASCDSPGHGRCECRKCICDTNYTGSACDCSTDTSTCAAKNGQVCNGRGTCECGVCKCTNPKFQGPTCEICPTCPGVCTEQKWVLLNTS